MILGLIFSISLNLNVPPALALAVCQVESNFRNVINTNDGGSPSYGPCQIKLIAARHVGFEGNAFELTDAENSIYWALKYLKYKLKKYNNNYWHAVAAYNAGRVKFKNKKYINHKYVLKVKKAFRKWVIRFRGSQSKKNFY